MECESVCLHYKRGYCKYRESCRFKHIDAICNNVNCDIQKCENRHPKRCRYFFAYGCCMFGSNCSYIHISSVQNDAFEDFYQLRNEFNINKHEVVSLKSRLEIIEEKVRNIIGDVKNIIETAVKSTTESLVMTMNARQNENEQHISTQFEALNSEIKSLLSVISSVKTTAPTLPMVSNNTAMPLTTSIQCDECRKTFGSRSALTNHLKKNHI